MQELLTTYLELIAPPNNNPLVAPMDGVTVAAERPAYCEYMRLWRLIGDPLDWDGRRLAPSETVDAVLKSPDTEIFIARFRGEAFGLCEFNQIEPRESELVYFGLSPAFQGRRLGPFFLDVSLREYWGSKLPTRIWLHTDTSDHPKALSLYERAGFKVIATVYMPSGTTEQEYRSFARTPAGSARPSGELP
ncbi:hypothetical protein BRAO375_2560021 [Bradyrhizobium sp. ORS 375]|uniref:GNAT family N-acetyltransferase n=1 Tax=Bradyrhizobium sp. (strain ORS 375) TaxID=566679 RepID=UPI0002409677|nr:GNAT family N-acetyltransferase [Bradyrhizobium sp. ORS 375]CCD93352.1 hypothetical protein BRAO375_2560021 [Bradyrhizobium sp. ORS 375]